MPVGVTAEQQGWQEIGIKLDMMAHRVAHTCNRTRSRDPRHTSPHAHARSTRICVRNLWVARNYKIRVCTVRFVEDDITLCLRQKTVTRVPRLPYGYFLGFILRLARSIKCCRKIWQARSRTYTVAGWLWALSHPVRQIAGVASSAH